MINEYPDEFDNPEYEGDRVRNRDRPRRGNRKLQLQTPIVHVTVNNTNQQAEAMSNDKIWNGDRVAGNKMQINTVQGDAIAGNKIVNSQNLTQAAQDIKDLLDQISATDTTNNQTLIAMKAIEAIEKNPTLKERILNAGKEAGFAALDAAVEHPAIKIVTAAIKGAMT